MIVKTDPPTIPCNQFLEKSQEVLASTPWNPNFTALEGLPKLSHHLQIPSIESSIPRTLVEMEKGTSIYLLPTTQATLGHRAIPSCKGSWELEVAMTHPAEEFRRDCPLACPQ